ncbi:MAG: hypothetical protein ACRDG4_11140 [Chloroflexota bacterium]
MTTLKTLRRAVGLGMLRLLFSRHGVSVLLASMLLGAGGAVRYLDQSPRQVVPHTTAGGGGPDANCWTPSRAAFAYIPETNQFYCVPYPS